MTKMNNWSYNEFLKTWINMDLLKSIDIVENGDTSSVRAATAENHVVNLFVGELDKAKAFLKALME